MLGPIAFDEKGDITGIETFEWFVWTKSEYAPLEEAAGENRIREG